jgi:hypothetical protein
MDFREGSTDSGPWSNIRVIPSATTNVVSSTIGIFVGNPSKGVSGADIILAYSGTANQPWAAIMADGTSAGTSNFTISNCHWEYAYTGIEVVPNYTGQGIEINNCLGAPSGTHSGFAGIRFLADGTLCKSCLVLNTTSQSSGYTDTILDDINALTCTDLSLATYETNMNGFPSRTNCIAGTAAPILAASLTANYNSGSAYTLFTPLSASSATICASEASANTPTGATLPQLQLGWTDPTSTAKTVNLLASTGSVSSKSVYATNGINSSSTASAGSCAKIITNGSTAVTITSSSYAAGSGTALSYDLVVTWSIP